MDMRRGKVADSLAEVEVEERVDSKRIEGVISVIRNGNRYSVCAGPRLLLGDTATRCGTKRGSQLAYISRN
jgi:hypothetical protein